MTLGWNEYAQVLMRTGIWTNLFGSLVQVHGKMSCCGREIFRRIAAHCVHLCLLQVPQLTSGPSIVVALQRDNAIVLFDALLGRSVLHVSPSNLSPFLTNSLCRADRYFRHPVFTNLCHVFSQLVFLHVFV